jgi:hypothetical protein
MMNTINNSIYTLLLIIGLLLIMSCAPTVYSPHAQNEMITPYNREGEVHEFGSASAFNYWLIRRNQDTVYIQTYPIASIGFFHNAYFSTGALGGIGGVEFIGFPTQWVDQNVSGFILGIKPYLGIQYARSIITCRLNFSPFSLAVGVGDGEWSAGGSLSRLTLYQLTFLLHNRQPAANIFWGGVRNSPAALGFVAGHEYAFNDFTFLRTEYSILIPPPFSFVLRKKELESIKGTVFYVTIGVFTQIN